MKITIDLIPTSQKPDALGFMFMCLLSKHKIFIVVRKEKQISKPKFKYPNQTHYEYLQ